MEKQYCCSSSRGLSEDVSLIEREIGKKGREAAVFKPMTFIIFGIQAGALPLGCDHGPSY